MDIFTMLEESGIADELMAANTNPEDDEVRDAFLDDPETEIALADEKKVQELIDKIPADDDVPGDMEKECGTSCEEGTGIQPGDYEKDIEPDEKEKEEEELKEADEKVEYDEDKIDKQIKEDEPDPNVNLDETFFLDDDLDFFLEGDLADTYPDEDEYLAQPGFSADADDPKTIKGKLGKDSLEDIYPDDAEYIKCGSDDIDEDDDVDEMDDEDLEEMSLDFDFFDEF